MQPTPSLKSHLNVGMSLSASQNNIIPQKHRQLKPVRNEPNTIAGIFNRKSTNQLGQNQFLNNNFYYPHTANTGPIMKSQVVKEARRTMNLQTKLITQAALHKNLSQRLLAGPSSTTQGSKTIEPDN